MCVPSRSKSEWLARLKAKVRHMSPYTFSIIVDRLQMFRFTGSQSALGPLQNCYSYLQNSVFWPSSIPSWSISPYQPSGSLWSSNQLLLTVLRAIFQSVSALCVTHLLASGIPSLYPSIGTFKHCLKSFYFNYLVSQTPTPSDCPRLWFKLCLTVFINSAILTGSGRVTGQCVRPSFQFKQASPTSF